MASAQSADSRGNSYRTNGGLVTMPTPNPPRNVTTRNPNPGTNVSVQSPNPPTNVNLENPNPPTNVNVQNPDAGNSDVQNPKAPITIAGGSQLSTLNMGGAPGDAVVVTGQGFGRSNMMFINVVDSAPSGTPTRAPSRATRPTTGSSSSTRITVSAAAAARDQAA